MIELFAILYITLLGFTILLLLTGSRFSKKHTAIVITITIAVVVSMETHVYCSYDLDKIRYLYSLLAHVPTLAAAAYLSRLRFIELLFHLLSAVFYCSLIQYITSVLYYFSENSVWIPVFFYPVLSVLMIVFLVKYIRPMYRKTLGKMNHNIGLLCIIFCMYYIITMYIIPYCISNLFTAAVLKLSVSILTAACYWIVLLFFDTWSRIEEEKHNREVIALQISSMKNRLQAMHSADESVKILRHDIRHHIHIISSLIQSGDTDKALEMLQLAENSVHETTHTKWCNSTVLDAIFSSYFSQAEQKGIRINAKISLSESIKTFENELSIAIANALENAIIACEKLSIDQRVINCHIISSPTIVIEISNPCPWSVSFNKEGIPIVSSSNHGFGTRSILNFCHRYDASCHFKHENDMFYVTIVL